MVGEQKVAIPIYANGRWTKKEDELEYDTKKVIALTLHCLMFNVKDFFQDDELKQALGSVSASTPLSPSK